ncbi:hypothetical protein CAPN004_01260 [Capnocytophaga cynodegmi]|uniref:hypothetical protein n=1 Tax=Capnocytophaga cynodegmi TaxID=28189 RepID=UPI001AD123DA|nr:hypothetical protein [Capnocytophaga cynodegmi]GIM51096.1 hypothetical protein CAPN004_01260 [Capnocytophaga cynodegmi]
MDSLNVIEDSEDLQIIERYDFEIRNGWLSTAYLDRPKTKGSWNVDMHGGKYEFYVTIFRAAHHLLRGHQRTTSPSSKWILENTDETESLYGK